MHLHEAALPLFEEATGFVAAAHAQNRPVAVHCVSEVELVFALALFDEAGARAGDRIEHASVASPELVRRIADLDPQALEALIAGSVAELRRRYPAKAGA